MRATRPVPSDHTAPTLGAAQVEWVAAQFGRAPSVNNTQPWRLEWTGTQFRVLADRDRQLAVADPEARELTISCGAALYGLRLALRQLEVPHVVRRIPDPDLPDLIAEVDVTAPPHPRGARMVMPPGFQRRHTRRGAAAPLPVTVAQAVAMQEAAANEGAELWFVNEVGPLQAILRLTHEAEWRASSDVASRRETAQWTSLRAREQRDGVPATAFGRGSASGAGRQLAHRDFDLDRGIGRLAADAVEAHQVAVLTTYGDGPEDWIRAGEALHAVLVTAADQWVFAEINSRVAELPDARVELARQLGTLHHPHLVLQFVAADTAPRTPRRAVSDYLAVRPEESDARVGRDPNGDQRL